MRHKCCKKGNTLRPCGQGVPFSGRWPPPCGFVGFVYRRRPGSRPDGKFRGLSSGGRSLVFKSSSLTVCRLGGASERNLKVLEVFQRFHLPFEKALQKKLPWQPGYADAGARRCQRGAHPSGCAPRLRCRHTSFAARTLAGYENACTVRRVRSKASLPAHARTCAHAARRQSARCARATRYAPCSPPHAPSPTR